MDTLQAKKIHDFITIYFKNSEDPVSPPGIKDEDLLESSINRPNISIGGEDAYKGVFTKAAALFHSIINNHCFYNGNKRTALLTTLVYLGEKGFWVNQPTDEEMFEFTRKAAAHELTEDRKDEINFISEWFQKNSRRRKAGEKQLKFNELKDILQGFGFEVGDVNGTTCDISKDGKKILNMRHKGKSGQEDYDKAYINKLRKKLKLTPDYGVDSFAFYGEQGLNEKLGKYVKMRESVMRWLAKI